jgi:hypothetical protein
MEKIFLRLVILLSLQTIQVLFCYLFDFCHVWFCVNAGLLIMLGLPHRGIRWILFLVIRVMFTFLLNIQLLLAGGIQTLLRLAKAVP